MRRRLTDWFRLESSDRLLDGVDVIAALQRTEYEKAPFFLVTRLPGREGVSSLREIRDTTEHNNSWVVGDHRKSRYDHVLD